MTDSVNVIRKFGQGRKNAGRFRNAAYAVFCTPEKLVAVIRTDRGYFLPGGGAEPGETPADTVRREVYEEMGCKIEHLRRIGEAVQFFSADDGEHEMYAVFFTGEVTEKLVPVGDELCWIPFMELEGRMYHECHLWAVRCVVGADTPGGIA